MDLLRHEIFESRFEGIFKTDYKTAHNATVKSDRPWEIPEIDREQNNKGDKLWQFILQ